MWEMGMESEKIETSLRMAYRDNRLTEEQVARLQKIEFPFISRKEIVLGVNDLATLFPHLVEEWDKEKNGPLDLDKVHIGSPQRVWWLCPKCGLSYRKAIRQRTGRGGSGSVGCPICEGRVSRGVPAVTKYPILLDYFDSEKNKDIDLYELTASSDCLIKWKCPVCGYEWENSVAHFVLNLRRASKKGVKYQCPACSLHVLVPEINSLAARDPRLSSEWDIERNYPLMPNQVTYLSSKKVWWKCHKCNGSYRKTVRNMLRDARDCPYCNNRKVLEGYNDLETLFPDIAAQWHPDRNGDLLPSAVLAGSNKSVWWKCPTCGHEWSSRIVNRTRYRDAICPSCRNGGRPRSFVRNIETGCVYATYSDAAMAVGIRKGSSIKRAIDMGGCCGGYHWEYVDD